MFNAIICINKRWLNFFPPTLEHVCTFFIEIAQMGLILPRLGLVLPGIPSPTPVFYSAVTHPLQGYVCAQNTANPTPKHFFSWPEIESGQNEIPSGQFGPQLAKMFGSGQNFLEVAKKNYSSIKGVVAKNSGIWSWLALQVIFNLSNLKWRSCQCTTGTKNWFKVARHEKSNSVAFRSFAWQQAQWTDMLTFYIAVLSKKKFLNFISGNLVLTACNRV